MPACFYDLSFSSATDLLNGAPYNRWRNLLGPTLVAGGDVIYGFAPNLRLPYSLEWNVTLERSMGADAAASAAYVGSAGRRLLRREGLDDAVLATNNGRSAITRYNCKRAAGAGVEFKAWCRTRGRIDRQRTAGFRNVQGFPDMGPD